MTQCGESAYVASSTDDETENAFLRFQLIDESGNPICSVPYKTVKSGESADPLHIPDGKTSLHGNTTIVSTVLGEEIDFYIVWAKLIVNKGFLKF